MKRWVLCLAVACACPAKQGKGPQGGSGGAGSGGNAVVTPPAAGTPKTCDEVKPRVEQMYRVEAQAKEPKRVDDAVADNTAMVMKDCATDPAKFVPCLAQVPTIAELERQCLIPLDDEGTEAEGRK